MIFVRKVQNMSEKTISVNGVNHPKTRVGMTKMDKLIDAAEELFSTKGFYQTSIVDICRGAGSAVGTFYIYFETKTDIYRFMMKKYEKEIKSRLSEAIKNATTRYEKEREGIKCFIKYAVKTPNVYNIIWGSLSIDRNMFVDYYVSFSKSYTKALSHEISEVNTEDPTTMAYALMGVSNFLGLRAMFESMSDEEIDAMIDNTLMPSLLSGVFKKT